MTNLYLQTSGDFDKLDPMMRFEAREEIFSFLERHKLHFRELNIHAHLKLLNASLGNNLLVRCSLNFFTNRGRFHVVEEGFGIEAALKSALLTLRYQVEKHLDIMQTTRERVEGRKVLGAGV